MDLDNPQRSKSPVIWCNAFRNRSSEDFLRQALRGKELLFSKLPTDSIPEDTEIIFGHPAPDQLFQLRRLRWIHLDSAGYTPYDTPAVREYLSTSGIPLSNSSPVYADPCAQHLLAFMLSGARRLPQAFAEIGGWDQWSLREHCITLTGQTVMILGYGQIGRRLAELLTPFNVLILAVRRRAVPPDGGVRFISHSEIDAHIGQVDHLVNILPDNPSTRCFVDSVLLRKLKNGASFYNIGRGTTVDQEALIEVLNAGRLRGAFLDVTEPEPLPAEHPLWQASNCFITPHVGGGQRNEFDLLARHFVANWERYQQGESLLSRVF